ncbi:MAG: ETC complex I subunit [Alphaproteobacteria bacterium]|nr:ETC complex I subunit [Alphaproteobacteria bacterium]HCP00706.1 ETC complex I subunit [Rhodospirillaceae bacterium]
MKARIFKPTKTAMQSGRAKTQNWVLEFEPTHRQQLDPLMGWPGAGDTMQQVRLTFETRDEAVAHAESRGLEYMVRESKKRVVKPIAYADNFAFRRRIPWSH